jgi:hypothetical protein
MDTSKIAFDLNRKLSGGKRNERFADAFDQHRHPRFVFAGLLDHALEFFGDGVEKKGNCIVVVA